MDIEMINKIRINNELSLFCLPTTFYKVFIVFAYYFICSFSAIITLFHTNVIKHKHVQIFRKNNTILTVQPAPSSSPDQNTFLAK